MKQLDGNPELYKSVLKKRRREEKEEEGFMAYVKVCCKQYYMYTCSSGVD